MTRAAALTGSLLALVGNACATPEGEARRPNVLLVTIDTLRADRLACYGGPAPTPTLDELASRGVRFATAIAPAPLTAPSHASILTGLIPPRHGVRDNGAFALPETPPVLAERFRAAGYAAAAFVSGFPLDRRFGFARGFHLYDDRLPRGRDPRRAPYVERPADQTTRAALAWIQGRPAPWFAWIHYFDPHAPYDPPGELASGRTPTPYDGEIAFVDRELGRLLAGAARERTFVLVTADHGESLGEHGEETHGVFVYDATLRVPLLLAGPGLPGSRVVSRLVALVDVAPTLLDLAGIPPLANADGRSLVGAARGDHLAEEPVYAESLFVSLHLGWAPLFALRTPRFKFIRAPRPELYRVDADPAEAHDIADAHGPALGELQARLERLLSKERRGASVTPAADAKERLRALGYLGGLGTAVARRGGPLKDAKDGIALVNRLERGVANARSDPQSAITDLSAVVAEDSEVPLARRYLALARYSAGQTAAAHSEIEALERDGLAEVDDLLLLADAFRSEGRLSEALTALERADKHAPGSPDVSIGRGRTFAALGRPVDARRAFEEALARAPEHPEAERALAELALFSGDMAQARARLERILLRDPEDVRALVRLGVVALRQGRLEESLARFRAAVDLEPADTEALLDLGGLLAKMGRFAEAVPFLERAVTAGARTPQALNGLGFARLESGDRRGALEALTASLALDRRQPDVAEAVARLRQAN